MSSTMSRMSHIPRELVGATGRRYCFKELLQVRPHQGSIWVATYEFPELQVTRADEISHGHEKVVMKDLPKSIFANFNERIWPQLQQESSTLLRLPIDTIPGRRTLVYQYLKDDLLRLVRSNIQMHARRQILKTALQAIADLHDRDIVHLDVKPDNIMVNYEHREGAIDVEQVMIIDLENAAHLPNGRCIKGMLAGNDNWRSVEAHFKSELSKPSDMFSFGLICLFAMLNRTVCGPDEDFEKHESQGAFPAAIRLQRLVSYFGDVEGVNGLMKHVGDDETHCQILSVLWEERNEEYIRYEPFLDWPEVEHDEAFRDLITRLMKLDPGKRITASQALTHPWFSN